jgi:hypothetical protein
VLEIKNDINKMKINTETQRHGELREGNKKPLYSLCSLCLCVYIFYSAETIEEVGEGYTMKY